MTINHYAKKWCEEDYDIRKEDFYMENAYYVAKREWISAAIKHGIISLIISIAIFMFGGAADVFSGILGLFVNIGILTICFWLYGMRSIDANSPETGIVIYILTLIFLSLVKMKCGELVQMLFVVCTIPMYIYLTIVSPIKFKDVVNNIKKRIREEEEENARADKESYSKWESEYKAYRYGLPAGNIAYDNPLLKEARKLFDGYTSDRQMLKTRYRQLAKQYHPDRGGDTELFRCIIEIYEEFAKNLQN